MRPIADLDNRETLPSYYNSGYPRKPSYQPSWDSYCKYYAALSFAFPLHITTHTMSVVTPLKLSELALPLLFADSNI